MREREREREKIGDSKDGEMVEGRRKMEGERERGKKRLGAASTWPACAVRRWMA
jgi:hypothetical protein